MNDLELATSRTWAEINLDELTHNIITLRKKLTPSAKFLGVVKANVNARKPSKFTEQTG